MTLTLPTYATAPDVPAGWPAALHPAALAALDAPTPFLAVDLDAVTERYRRLKASLPAARCHYAVKCNPSEPIVRRLIELGSGFEVASLGELNALRDLGVSAERTLYSNTIKPSSHIAAAHEAGLWRFAVDSHGELEKIAKHAPGAAVYVRLRVDDSTSEFPLSRKFGAEADVARSLLLAAPRLGLVPYGITFHVGSQCTTPAAWRSAIGAAGRLMRDVRSAGICLEMLDVGGGFPARYVSDLPSIERIGFEIQRAIVDLLPYRPGTLVVEPGRYLVAECGVMVATVLGREHRAGEEWLYLDVGVYNGLMETQQTNNTWVFPMSTSRWDRPAGTCRYIVAGPSCDSADTMFLGLELPDDLAVDDRIYIASAGAYTLSYASNFNGFASPSVVVVPGR